MNIFIFEDGGRLVRDTIKKVKFSHLQALFDILPTIKIHEENEVENSK